MCGGGRGSRGGGSVWIGAGAAWCSLRSRKPSSHRAVWCASPPPPLRAAYYYITYTTIELFASSLTAKTKLKVGAALCCAAQGCESSPLPAKHPCCNRPLLTHSLPTLPSAPACRTVGPAGDPVQRHRVWRGAGAPRRGASGAGEPVGRCCCMPLVAAVAGGWPLLLYSRTHTNAPPPPPSPLGAEAAGARAAGRGQAALHRPAHQGQRAAAVALLTGGPRPRHGGRPAARGGWRHAPAAGHGGRHLQLGLAQPRARGCVGCLVWCGGGVWGGVEGSCC